MMAATSGSSDTGGGTAGGGTTAPPPADTSGALQVGRSLLGWGVIFLVLIGMADFDSTAPLATSFAWLIFLSVLLRYGQQAFGNISSLVGGKAA